MRFLRSRKRILVVPLLLAFVVAAGTASIALAVCGPFTDVGTLICPFVLSMYYLGVTAGTTSTTFAPGSAVTRGQMAIFMGALYNQVKRTENSYRVANRRLNPFNVNYTNFASVNTNSPNGFCTDGIYDYVANQGNNKIDAYERGVGYPYIGSYTMVNSSNRLSCDGVALYAASDYGTSVAKIDLRTMTITDPWVTIADGSTGDIADAGFSMAVTSTSGITIFHKDASIVGVVTLDSGAYGVVTDGYNYYAETPGGNLYKIDQAGNILATVPLTNGGTYYPAFDGQNVWCPLTGGSIDIVATSGAQANTIVETKGPAIIGTTDIGGLVFTGQYMMVPEKGDYGCGGGPGATALVAYDAATHGLVQYIGSLCGEGYYFTIGWDGQHIITESYNSATIHVW